MKLSKIQIVSAFLLALAAGFGANEAQARIKLRCVDPACVAECQQHGGGGCLNLCVTDCEQ
jgi:hypothetical protein